MIPLVPCQAMGLSHRTVVIWITILATLVVLVIYLDGGLQDHPIILFITLSITDVCLMFSNFVFFYQEVVAAKPFIRNRTEKWKWLRYAKHLRGQIAMNVGLLCKMMFESLQFLRVIISITIPIYIHLIPIWIGLIVAIHELTLNVIALDKKIIAKQTAVQAALGRGRGRDEFSSTLADTTTD